ncbi:hypothetical protein [uncultured Tissierella sp.]|uniref:hypothetical protein n=1 Tax=uncultured Tissierella sp. TaxID=448160 RepID=UPI0028050984|nr:hypothetical protein [uncultured Tissierella sp.]MDU5080234.1 hypothetical protein [Bacillota bacterium]
MKILTEIKELDHNLKSIQDAIKSIRELDVLVGVPQEKDSREGAISNAELAFIHTKGSPLRGIPARPIIEPAIEDNKEQVAELIKKSAQKALDGNKEGAIESLERVGMQGQNIVRAWFTNPKNNWAPNSPKTIKLKGSTRPLIDSGELRKSITYVVRKRGR